MKDLEKTAMPEELRAALKNEIAKIPEVLAQMEPKDRLDVLIKLMPHVYPQGLWGESLI